MKKTLLATVAAAAVVGFTSFAVAQGTMDQKGGGQTPGAAEQKAAPSGGPAMHQQSDTPRPAPSAQGTDKTTNPDQRMGQEQKNTTKPDQRMGQEQKDTTKPDRRMGQEQKDTTKPDRRMGQEQKDTAKPDQRMGREQKDETTRGVQTESGKAGTNAAERQDKAGANVRLSQDQRSRISSVIGHGSGAARVSSNVNFNIAVGTRVPRDVHIAVLPEDIVTIVPEYRGFNYIVVGNRILIIDPDSLEIVTIIES